MPEVHHAVRPATHEPGPKHNIGTIFENRFKKDGILTRVVLEVGVLNDNQVTRSCLKTHSQRCSFPKIPFLQHEPVDPPWRFRFEKFSCPIGRSVVHNNNFHVFDWCRANCFNYSFNRRSFIITRDNDGELHLHHFSEREVESKVGAAASVVNVMITALELDFSLRFQLYPGIKGRR